MTTPVSNWAKPTNCCKSPVRLQGMLIVHGLSSVCHRKHTLSYRCGERVWPGVQPWLPHRGTVQHECCDSWQQFLLFIYPFTATDYFSVWNSGCCPWGECLAIVWRHPFFLLPCVFVNLWEQLFSYRIARDNSHIAEGSFTCTKYMLHKGRQFIISSKY